MLLNLFFKDISCYIKKKNHGYYRNRFDYQMVEANLTRFMSYDSDKKCQQCVAGLRNYYLDEIGQDKN